MPIISMGLIAFGMILIVILSIYIGAYIDAKTGGEAFYIFLFFGIGLSVNFTIVSFSMGCS